MIVPPSLIRTLGKQIWCFRQQCLSKFMSTAAAKQAGSADGRKETDMPVVTIEPAPGLRLDKKEKMVEKITVAIDVPMRSETPRSSTRRTRRKTSQ